MECFSVSHAPRSMSRQRSLQKGREGDCDQSISRWQVGHLTCWDGHQGQQVQEEFHVRLALRGPLCQTLSS